MDLSLIIFLAVSAFFVYRGFRKGLLRSLAGIFALVGGYLSVIFLVGALAEYLQAQTGLQGFLPMIIAALLLFIAAGVVVRILFAIIGKTLPGTDRGSKLDAFGGAAVGLLTGVVVATLAVWGLNYVREMNGLGAVADTTQTRPERSAIEKFVGKATGEVVGAALSLADSRPEVSRLGKALIESPGVVTGQVKRLSESPALQQLFNDPEHQAALNSGDVDAVQALPAFRELMRNQDMLSLAQTAGMLDEASGAMEGEAELASRFSDIWRRVQRVKDDERVKAILSDEEFIQKLQQGDPMTLIGDSRVSQLTELILSAEAAPQVVEEAPPKKPRPPTKVYSWKDAQGRMHYTDEDPAR